MARFSAATDEAIQVIAHHSIAQRMSKDINGMDGFYEFYEKSMTPKDKEVMRRFEEHCREACIDLSESIQQELQSDGQ